MQSDGAQQAVVRGRSWVGPSAVAATVLVLEAIRIAGGPAGVAAPALGIAVVGGAWWSGLAGGLFAGAIASGYLAALALTVRAGPESAAGMLAWAAALPIMGAVAGRMAVRARGRSAEWDLLAFHVENAPIAVIEWNAQFLVRRWSGGAQRMFGWRESEVLGRHFDEFGFVHPDDRDRVAAVANRLKQGLDTRNRSLNRNLTRSGDVVHCDWHNSVLRRESGEVVAVVSFVMDVTARVAAEALVQSSESRMRALLDALPDLIFRMSREGVYLSYHVPEGAPLLASPSEFLGRGVADVLPPALAKMCTDNIKKALEAGQPVEYEYSVMREDRARHWEVRIVPCGNDEVLCVVRDVTERRALERELVSSRRSESLGQLAGGIAHDFNNLLTAIFAYLGLARTTLPESHPAAASLDGLEQSAQQAAGVTRALLTYSKRGTSDKRPTDMRALALRAEELLRALLPASVHVLVEVEQPPHADGAWVLADATQLQQMILNLALNARDAMPFGGEFIIGVQRAGNEIRLTARDTGVGMTPEVMQRAFEPFFTTKEGSDGNGLGLAIAESIVRDHSGHISVASEPGMGTTFTVILPTIKPPVGATAPAMNGTSAQSELALVATGKAMIRAVISTALRGAGFRVMEAEDAVSARDAIRSHASTLAIIIVDKDSIGESIEVPTGSRARVISMIANSDDAGEEEIPLVKPVQIGTLVDLSVRVIREQARQELDS